MKQKIKKQVFFVFFSFFIFWSYLQKQVNGTQIDFFFFFFMYPLGSDFLISPHHSLGIHTRFSESAEKEKMMQLNRNLIGMIKESWDFTSISRKVCMSV